MDAAIRLGYTWPTVCHGDGTCTICWIEVMTGDGSLSSIQDLERNALTQLPARIRNDRVVRLACQARVFGDAVVSKKGVRRSLGDCQ
jgi:2Fe-2S ferredoxin